MNRYIMNDQREPVPASMEEYIAWQERMGDFERSHRVAYTELSSNTVVSTVFLGLEHPGGFFETLVRRGDDYIEDSQRRYRTWEEAETGHAEVVARYAKVVAFDLVNAKGGLS